MKWEQVFPGEAWCVEDLLSESEATSIVGSGKAEGIESQPVTRDTRDNQRVAAKIEMPSMTDVLCERVKNRIPQEVVFFVVNYDQQIRGLANAPDDRSQFNGRWTPSQNHPRVNVAHCTGEGYPTAYRDDDRELNEHEGSFLTVFRLSDRTSTKLVWSHAIIER